mmetsp:Transcript_5827/g.13893  ORF Transcript_5827/g.13893 Transcript_5827/m.13893 type:complete len:1174 (+) Transcript_5827:51-3572(+)
MLVRWRCLCSLSLTILPILLAGSSAEEDSFAPYLAHASAGTSLTAYSTAFSHVNKALEDDVSQTCDVDDVQEANWRQLYPILQDLVKHTFFRLFRVSLKRPKCPYWVSQEEASAEHSTEEQGASCGGGEGPGFTSSFLDADAPEFSSAAEDAPPPCSVDAEEDGGYDDAQSAHAAYSERVDRTMTPAEKLAMAERNIDGASDCEFEEDLPTYWADMCNRASIDGEFEDVNLLKNPERNTGYNGSHIWEAMYNENCFEVGSALPRGRFGGSTSMCYEERVLYRLLSGWHASTSISIFKNYYAPGTKVKGKWAPAADRFMQVLGSAADRLKNLHFAFVVVLRAVKKAAPFLESYQYTTGDGSDENQTRSLMVRLLESQVLSVCSPVFGAFDETRLFGEKSSEQRRELKRQFKNVFQNITVLVDCVQCQRCRLHAKLFSLGLGTALKVLLTPPELLASTTTRDEVVALVNVLAKFSESIEDAKALTHLYWEEHERKGMDIPKGTPSAGERDANAATKLPQSQQSEQTSGLDRLGLLDIALRAVKQTASSGLVTQEAEESALRALVVAPASAELLLLAKHYAEDRPHLFTRLAHESSTVTAGLRTPGVVLPGAAVSTYPPDAVVIGGGLAGMVATLSLLDRGASVVLIDKQAYLGGNSGKASSGINAALETSVESLLADTTKSAAHLARSTLIEKLATESAPAVSWLQSRLDVDLSMRSQLGGHSAKRTLRPSNGFVGAELTFAIGELLKKLATELPDRFKLMLKSKWTDLEKLPQGRWQVLVEADGASRAVEAAAVIVASGGFGRDQNETESFMHLHRPDLAEFPATLGPQTTGDGLRIARKIGAKLIDMDRVQLHPTGFVDPAKPEEKTKTLGAELLRGVGGMLLDKTGARFTNELGTRQAVVDAMLAKAANGSRAFPLVLNGKAAAMADRHTTLYSKKGLLTKVHGVEGLAAHLGLDPETLKTTFIAYNAAAERGLDEFNRTVFPQHWPIEFSEDFFVGLVTPVIHYTMGGIAIDTDAHVLSDSDSQPIPGLYAIGEASGGVHGNNRLAGNSLLECTVFGRHIGTTLPIRSSGVEKTLLRPSEGSAGLDASSPESSSLAIITQAELAQHKTPAQGVWVALYGAVYDLTDYVEEHPGGDQAILDVAGVDGTEHFETVHNRQLLDSMGFKPIGLVA